MKKTILALVALSAFSANNALATPVPVATHQAATHAKIIIDGLVVTQTCEIAQNDRTVMKQLDPVGTNSLQRAGDVAGQQLVTLHLENCALTNGLPAGSSIPLSNKVSVTFNHTTQVDTDNQFTLKNKSTSDPASNVNIQFANLDGSGIKIGAGDRDAVLAPENLTKTPTINFLARYYATGPAQPGNVQAEAELDLAYQ